MRRPSILAAVRTRLHQQAPDRGSSVLEAVIVIPVIVILSMIVIQMTLIWHARHVAQAAADTGAQSAAAYMGTAADGQHTAAAYLTATAPTLLPAPQVTAARTRTTVTITVHSPVLTLIPFGNFDITATGSAPVERFTP